MECMGDRATLLETGRFVQRHVKSAADDIIEAVVAGGEAVDTTAENETETEARHRRAAESGDAASMSVLGALLLRRGDLDGAEPYLRGATAEGTARPPTTWVSCCTSVATPKRPQAGGGSPPSRAPRPPPTRSAATTASAATSLPPSTGCASPPSRATPWAPTRSPTSWSTAATSAPSAGCAPPPSGVTARPRTDSPSPWSGAPRK